jgi:hypothetical protein
MMCWPSAKSRRAGNRRSEALFARGGEAKELIPSQQHGRREHRGLAYRPTISQRALRRFPNPRPYTTFVAGPTLSRLCPSSWLLAQLAGRENVCIDVPQPLHH